VAIKDVGDFDNALGINTHLLLKKAGESFLCGYGKFTMGSNWSCYKTKHVHLVESYLQPPSVALNGLLLEHVMLATKGTVTGTCHKF
jgi:hypothetical protein